MGLEQRSGDFYESVGKRKFLAKARTQSCQMIRTP